MSPSTSHRAGAACRRRALIAAAYGSAPVHARAVTVTAAILPQSQRQTLAALAFAVIAAHGLLVLAFGLHFRLPPPLAKSHALDVEIDMRASAPPAMPDERQSPRSAAASSRARPTPLANARRDAPAHRPAPQRHVAPRQPLRSPHPVPARGDALAEPADQPAIPAAAHPSDKSTSSDATAAPAVPAPPVPAAPEAVTQARFAAAYLHNPAPDYPAIAQRHGWEGTTLLNVHVLASGRADQVLVSATSGHEALDDAAVGAVKDWRFVPAKRGAQAIDAWVKVPVVFKLGS